MNVNGRSGGICRLHLQGQRISQARNHLETGNKQLLYYPLRQEKFQKNFAWFQGGHMMCETDCLYLAFLERYQGQFHF
jgi:hypothetical protein